MKKHRRQVVKKRGRPKKKSKFNCHEKKSIDVPNHPRAAGVAAATRLRLEAEDYVQSAATVGGLEGGTEQAGERLLDIQQAAQDERGESDSESEQIASAGGIPPLVAALVRDGGTAWERETAAGALWVLAVNADNKVAIAAAGGIPPLVALPAL